ncbi:MAG: hypothetical protein CVU53_00320 [Deltaproteobacteria bacterium HGW-Deltaproteobacteria-11]|nr:MAG: hypothetical protein CVU53_00320 [Deltaproteobacteria bacterium HGW-Deltaproteobacteria-11]
MTKIDALTFRTGLDAFLMLDAITESGIDHIAARKTFTGAPLYFGIEGLAQLGAYHVRSRIGFARHAFLMKINDCRMTGRAILDGSALLHGARTGSSDAAYAYRLRLDIPGGVQMAGEFLFAVKPYASPAQEEQMRSYYQETYQCLVNATETG